MSEITDKFDEFMLHVTDHGGDMKARQMYRHLRTLMAAQDRALEMVIQENTAHTEEVEQLKAQRTGCEEEYTSMMTSRDEWMRKAFALQTRLTLIRDLTADGDGMDPGELLREVYGIATGKETK